LADKEFCFFDPLLSADEKNAIFKELEKKEEQILKNCKCGV